MSEKPSTETKPDPQEKPRVLYHASPHKNLTEIRPGRKRHRDPNEGPKIFAGRDPAIASMFMFDSDGSWVMSGRHNGVPYVVIQEKREKFIQRDQGGVIYELPNDGFTCDRTKSFGNNEWTCDANVKPIGSKEYPSALDAMIEHGVQVYFVDETTFHALQADQKEHGFNLIKTLSSENMRRGKNIVSFKKDST